MSEDEMLKEFEKRILALVRGSGARKHKNGLVTYKTNGWSVAVTQNGYIEIEVSAPPGHTIVYQKDSVFKPGRIIGADLARAGKLLQAMRRHMVLDDLAEI